MKSELGEVYIWIGFFLIGMSLLVFCFVIYLAYFRVKDVLACLRRSPLAYGKDVFGFAPIVRFAILGHAGMMLTFPRRSIKKGILDAKDYEEFLCHLKFLLRACNCCVWLLSMMMLGVWWMYF